MQKQKPDACRRQLPKRTAAAKDCSRDKPTVCWQTDGTDHPLACFHRSVNMAPEEHSNNMPKPADGAFGPVLSSDKLNEMKRGAFKQGFKQGVKHCIAEVINALPVLKDSGLMQLLESMGTDELTARKVDQLLREVLKTEMMKRVDEWANYYAIRYDRLMHLNPSSVDHDALQTELMEKLQEILADRRSKVDWSNTEIMKVLKQAKAEGK
ncbi:uncharacterized protein J3D65DRAFT_227428 [Phyllosticta citribraziliensis]|uniref:Uncharacterized protein n=1 Tax=Phyllosticta citribraziliensis TaxID=989973 RepID=A0ABR1M583_9PEZI